MEFLWFLDAPFWQKLEFVGMLAGVSIFMYFIFELLEGWNTKLRKLRNFLKQEMAKEKIRRKAWLDSHFKKVLSPILILLILASGVSLIPSVSAHDVAERFFLHPTSTYAINSSYWNPYPANGTYWDKLLSKDGNDSYIYNYEPPGGITYQILRPNSDNTPLTMITTPASPTTHYTKVNEVTKDDDASYNEGVTANQEDTYEMSDTTPPAGYYNLDVTIWHWSRDESGASSLTAGLDISGTNYAGTTGDLTDVYVNYSVTWLTAPSGGEWTFTAINNLKTYLLAVDATPDGAVSHV